jgi:hypothetical protein
MGQEFFNPFDGVFGNTSEDIAEPCKRIDSGQFARSNKTAENCRSPASVITSEESPVVTTHCETAQRTLGAVMPRAGLCRVFLSKPGIVDCDV